jgi:hypothetical protein
MRAAILIMRLLSIALVLRRIALVVALLSLRRTVSLVLLAGAAVVIAA